MHSWADGWFYVVWRYEQVWGQQNFLHTFFLLYPNLHTWTDGAIDLINLFAHFNPILDSCRIRSLLNFRSFYKECRSLKKISFDRWWSPDSNQNRHLNDLDLTFCRTGKKGEQVWNILTQGVNHCFLIPQMNSKFIKNVLSDLCLLSHKEQEKIIWR